MLAQAQNEDEKNEIEKKMESEPELTKILHALQATDKEDIVTEERARRQQDRRSRVAADIAAMDTDDNQVHLHTFKVDGYPFRGSKSATFVFTVIFSGGLLTPFELFSQTFEVVS